MEEPLLGFGTGWLIERKNGNQNGSYHSQFGGFLGMENKINVYGLGLLAAKGEPNSNTHGKDEMETLRL